MHSCLNVMFLFCSMVISDSVDTYNNNDYCILMGSSESIFKKDHMKIDPDKYDLIILNNDEDMKYMHS